ADDLLSKKMSLMSTELARQLANITTDPYFNGWNSDCNTFPPFEIADLCRNAPLSEYYPSGHITSHVDTYDLPELWVNSSYSNDSSDAPRGICHLLYPY